MICARCQKFYRVKRSGIRVEELMPTGKKHVGRDDVSLAGVVWSSYKLWVADLYECPECKHVVIGGFPFQPLSEHYKPEYAEMLRLYPPEYRIPDCGPRHLR